MHVYVLFVKKQSSVAVGTKKTITSKMNARLLKKYSELLSSY